MKIFDFIYKFDRNKAAKILSFFAAIFYVLMSTGIFFILSDSGFTSFSMLDVKFYYSANTFYQTISSMNQAMLNSYFATHIIDYLFILTFYPFLLIWLSKSTNKNSKWLILPLLAMIFDISENIIIDIEIFASVPTFIASIVGFITLLKFIMIISTVSIKLFLIFKSKRENN